MHLKEVQDLDPPPEAGRFATSIKASRAAGTPIPEIWHLFAYRPAMAKHLCGFTQELMRGPGALTPGRRELIAAWTSARNHCLF
jgi:hypothetical protein